MHGWTPETQGGWGESILDGLMDARYSNVASERDSEGRWKGKARVRDHGAQPAPEDRGPDRVGRGVGAGRAIRARLGRADRAAPARLGAGRSGQLLAQPGAHDEHAILMGQGLLRLTERRPEREEAAVAEIKTRRCGRFCASVTRR